MFNACLQTKRIRLLKRAGIVQSWFVLDGMHFHNFSVKQKATRAIFYRDNVLGLDSDAHFVAEQEDWQWFTWCILHVLSLCLKWGMKDLVCDGLLDSVHIAIASLKNGSGCLLTAVGTFVRTRMRYRTSTADEKESRRLFWTLGGVAVNMINFVMSVDPWFDMDNSALHVDASLENEADRFETAISVLSYFLRWHDFSETRWGAVGSCCRSWMTSAAIGIDMIVDIALHMETSHDRTYVAGYTKECTPQVRTYMLVVSTATYPAESLSLAMMEDDRLFLRFHEVMDDMAAEHEHVERLPLQVYALAAALALSPDFTAPSLHDAVLKCMDSSLAYLHETSLSENLKLPRSLCIGDVDANVRHFAANALPAGACSLTEQIWNCCQWNITSVIRNLQLAQDAPHSIQLVEKGISE